MDLADGQQASHFIEVGPDAANDAHVDGVGWANVADALGLGEELGELVGTPKGTGGSTEREDLSFNHDGR